MLDSNRVLCEVKTINMSQVEADRRDRVHHGEIRAFHVPVHVTLETRRRAGASKAAQRREWGGVKIKLRPWCTSH